jgi:hypothetical protein
LTKRNTTKKPTPQAPSTINSTAPVSPAEAIKPKTNTNVAQKPKQAKTPAKAQKPTLGSEVDLLHDEVVYANLQLGEAEAKIAELRTDLKDCQDELYDNYYKSWWKFTYERFVDSLYSVTKFFR